MVEQRPMREDPKRTCQPIDVAADRWAPQGCMTRQATFPRPVVSHYAHQGSLVRHASTVVRIVSRYAPYFGITSSGPR